MNVILDVKRTKAAAMLYHRDTTWVRLHMEHIHATNAIENRNMLFLSQDLDSVPSRDV